MKFKTNGSGSAQLRLKDGEDVQLIVDSYRSTSKDAADDYRFVLLTRDASRAITLGMSHKTARKFAVAILKELSQ